MGAQGGSRTPQKHCLCYFHCHRWWRCWRTSGSQLYNSDGQQEATPDPPGSCKALRLYQHCLSHLCTRPGKTSMKASRCPVQPGWACKILAAGLSVCCAPSALTAAWDPGESWLLPGLVTDMREKSQQHCCHSPVTSVFNVSPLRASKICSQPLLEVSENGGCLWTIYAMFFFCAATLCTW